LEKHKFDLIRLKSKMTRKATIMRGCCLTLALVLVNSSHVSGQTEKPEFGLQADELRSLLEKARTEHDVPAMGAGIIRPNDQPLLAVVGVRKRGADKAATIDDKWHLGSVTKPITGFLIALLVDQGLLDWDTPLEEIFPEQAEKWSPDVKHITPGHLLTHTAGLPRDELLREICIRELTKPSDSIRNDREDVVGGLQSIKLLTKPGEKFAYSNLGYVLLGAIVDKRSKSTWEEQLESKLFKPLRIKNWGLGGIGKKDMVEQPWSHRKDGTPIEPYSPIDMIPLINSAGRIHITLADYQLFLAELLRLSRGEKGLLTQATAQKMFTNPYPASHHSLSGWGAFRNQEDAKRLVLTHTGSNDMNYCSVRVMPDQNAAFIVVTNQGGPGGEACSQVADELRKRLVP
jgi:CubicO group peptidase (beta-lactamase class C family)